MPNKHSVQHQPDALNMRPVPHLDDAAWTAVGISAMQLIDLNLGNRGGLDASLDYGNALYEMQGERANPPWENCANIIVPVVFTAVGEMTSRLSGSALVPRPYTVAGKDSISTQYAHIVEQFYNSEYDENDWYDAYDTCIQLACRDGTAILEVLWEKKISETMQLVDGPVIGKDGNPSVDEFGQAIIKKQRQRVKKVEWDAVRYNPVELRDFILFPNYAPSIEVADGVARKRYMSERDMYSMVESGVFNADMVERIMACTSAGQDERPWDRQGNATYTIGGKLTIGDYAIPMPDGMHVARGPVEIWQILTSQFDLDGDGVCEENYIWVHDMSRLMAGFAPFEYEGGRPYFPITVMPRPNRFYGFSVPDVVGSVQEEASAQRNARLDWLDIASNPTFYTTPGYKDLGENESHRFGPGARMRVETPTDVGFIQLGDPPQALFQEEQSLMALADRSIGAPAAPAMPPANASAGGKQSGKAMQQSAALQGMQTNRMIVKIRKWMQKVFKYTHLLYVKYGKDQMSMLQSSSQGSTEVQVPREILALNYNLGVAGSGGPLDKENSRQDAMALYQLLTPSPLVQGDMGHLYNVTRNVIEKFDYPEITQFIGTLDEAKQVQQQQAQAQAEQQKEQMAAHIIEHSRVGKVKQPPPPPGDPNSLQGIMQAIKGQPKEDEEDESDDADKS
jgi:hypothetical protein